MSAAAWLAAGVVIAVCGLPAVYIQTRAWREPPPTPRQSDARQHWHDRRDFPGLGVQIRPDGHVYTFLTRRYLGPLAGAEATVTLAHQFVGAPQTGRAVIEFTTGQRHGHRVAARSVNPPHHGPRAPRVTGVNADVARFNELASRAAGGLAGFRRTAPAPPPWARTP